MAPEWAAGSGAAPRCAGAAGPRPRSSGPSASVRRSRPHSGYDLGGGVEFAVDGQRPVGAPVALAGLQPHQEVVARVMTRSSWMRGTGPWISRKLMPTSNPKDQSAANVTRPASANRCRRADRAARRPPGSAPQMNPAVGGSVGRPRTRKSGSIPRRSLRHCQTRRRWSASWCRDSGGQLRMQGEHRVPAAAIHVRQARVPGGVGGQNAVAFGEFGR